MTGSGELYLSILRRIIGPTEDKTLLDLCCGEMTQTRHLKFQDSWHIDVKDWPERPRQFTFCAMDVRKVMPISAHFDVCLCSDGIEHLTKTEGEKLIHDMEKVASLPIIFTPLDAYKIKPDSTEPDDHKCLWTPAEFEEIGWKTDVFPTWHRELGIGAFFAWKPL